MSARDDLSFEYVNECLDYDPETGEFRWRHRPVEHFPNVHQANAWNARLAVKEAGTIKHDCRTSYRRIKIDGRLYLAHRLAWLLHYGRWPDDQIDHIDQDGLNNRVNNLREVSHQVNHKNKRMRNDNTSGIAGVTWNAQVQKWQVRIGEAGKRKHLGYRDTFEEAVALRKAAERELGFTERHGKPDVEEALRRLYDFPPVQLEDSECDGPTDIEQAIRRLYDFPSQPTENPTR
jgi:hypothetical protein